MNRNAGMSIGKIGTIALMLIVIALIAGFFGGGVAEAFGFIKDTVKEQYQELGCDDEIGKAVCPATGECVPYTTFDSEFCLPGYFKDTRMKQCDVETCKWLPECSSNEGLLRGVCSTEVLEFGEECKKDIQCGDGAYCKKSGSAWDRFRRLFIEGTGRCECTDAYTPPTSDGWCEPKELKG